MLSGICRLPGWILQNICICRTGTICPLSFQRTGLCRSLELQPLDTGENGRIHYPLSGTDFQTSANTGTDHLWRKSIMVCRKFTGKLCLLALFYQYHIGEISGNHGFQPDRCRTRIYFAGIVVSGKRQSADPDRTAWTGREKQPPRLGNRDQRH